MRFSEIKYENAKLNEILFKHGKAECLLPSTCLFRHSVFMFVEKIVYPVFLNKIQALYIFWRGRRTRLLRQKETSKITQNELSLLHTTHHIKTALNNYLHTHM